MKVKVLNEFDYQTFPIVDGMIDIDENILKQIGITKKFDTNGNIVDYKRPVTKQDYEEMVDKKIRQKYSLSQELAILRQRDTKPQEYEEYNSYCEHCKAETKNELGMI